jgi:hypothetical protein
MVLFGGLSVDGMGACCAGVCLCCGMLALLTDDDDACCVDFP